jgi:3-hydroxybutyryl-CoA dehydratase
MAAQSSVSHVVGQDLAFLTRKITQDTIDRYAEASGDHNPLHVDPEYAASTQFGGPIAHGMLLLAYVSEGLTGEFGEAWLKGGRLKARFSGAAKPGDTITISGRVTHVNGANTMCDVQARNQLDEVLISAVAEVCG